MKTNKNYNQMTNCEVKKAAKAEVKAINCNPTYQMRKLNKFAQGKDTDLSDLKKAHEVSVIGICELYNRLEEAFAQGGFWWGSVMARQGMLLTSCKEVKCIEDGESDMTPLLQRDGFIWTEVVNGKLYSFKAAAEWNAVNIISSASMMLRFAEERARLSGNLYSWQIARKEAKAKASKKSKTSKKSGKELGNAIIAKAVKQLERQFAKGQLNSKELEAAKKALNVA